ncbi:hypothetical protein SESBI_32940 [Sesbania bispinosa]|nr:hypothetical protein SESBI_32940 [Sesbania bispinosa]
MWLKKFGYCVRPFIKTFKMSMFGLIMFLESILLALVAKTGHSDPFKCILELDLEVSHANQYPILYMRVYGALSFGMCGGTTSLGENIQAEQIVAHALSSYHNVMKVYSCTADRNGFREPRQVTWPAPNEEFVALNVDGSV